MRYPKLITAIAGIPVRDFRQERDVVERARAAILANSPAAPFGQSVAGHHGGRGSVRVDGQLRGEGTRQLVSDGHEAQSAVVRQPPAVDQIEHPYRFAIRVVVRIAGVKFTVGNCCDDIQGNSGRVRSGRVFADKHTDERRTGRARKV